MPRNGRFRAMDDLDLPTNYSAFRPRRIISRRWTSADTESIWERLNRDTLVVDNEEDEVQENDIESPSVENSSTLTYDDGYGPMEHRSISIDLRDVLKFLQTIYPFFIIFSLAFVLSYESWILKYLIYSLFLKFTTRVCQEKWYGFILSTLCASVFFVLIPESHLIRMILTLQSPNHLTFDTAMWSALVSDLALRFISLSLDCLVGFYWKKGHPFISCLLLCYRSVVPIPIWINYLEYVLQYRILSVLYLSLKILSSVHLVHALYNSWGLILSRKPIVGEYLHYKNTSALGNCSICFDILHKPIKLACSHLFCEECILKWLSSSPASSESAATCPLCRSSITEFNHNCHSSLKIARNASDLGPISSNLSNSLTKVLLESLPQPQGLGNGALGKMILF